MNPILLAALYTAGINATIAGAFLYLRRLIRIRGERRQQAAWLASTTEQYGPGWMTTNAAGGNGWQQDTEAIQAFTAAEYIDDALPHDLVHQLQQLYVLEEETQ